MEKPFDFPNYFKKLRANKGKGKVPYNVLSPDGFAIDPTATYKTKSEARAAAIKWVKRFKTQGYYSSVPYGRLDYIEILSYCMLVLAGDEIEVGNAMMSGNFTK